MNIHNHFPIASNIICHGTRSGGEQKEFLNFLKGHGLIIEATNNHSKWITYACSK